MQLKVVLLPDPFGPIRPRISPSSTANETSWTARKAPNRFESPDTLSIGMQASVIRKFGEASGASRARQSHCPATGSPPSLGEDGVKKIYRA